jgi:hypothetical protein
LGRGYPDDVPTALERLDRAFSDADTASGVAFFRRLRDYKRLLDSDDVIQTAVERIQRQVEVAEERLKTEDEGVIHDLVQCREELVARAPELNDSGQSRPQGSLIDLEARERLERWVWTLSNFDAIAADADGKIIQRGNLDGTRARMLGEILNAKLYNLLYPTRRITSRRPDLDDLYRRVNEARSRHVTAQVRLEEVAQESGFLPLRRVALVVSFLQPRESTQTATADEERESAESILMEVTGGFHNLREAVRPDEARGPLAADAQQSVERHEPESKRDLADLHRALRLQVEEVERDLAPRGWNALSTSQKIQVAGITAASIIGIAAIVVTVLLAS